ncbi:MAG TPA: hypothetical protein VM008_20670 [Phycisphaerae bacterium]|nr:hypothetical protein [Phycisphaerae bacterium]
MAAPPTESILVAPSALPKGFGAINLLPDFKASPLRLNILAREQPDPVAGHFVTLRTLLDAIVYLGAITDAGGRLHGYVEIWVQNLDGLDMAPAAAREALSNKILDERWARLFKSFDALDDHAMGALFRTGMETAHPRPLFYDAEKREVMHPTDPFSNGAWALCTDDAVLAGKGLPPYSSSLHRYLYVAGDAKSPLIPVTPNAPTNAGTAPLSEITGPKGSLIPISTGGLLLVRTYAPAPLDAFFDLLSGGTWEGILSGRAAVHLNNLNELLENKDGGSAAAAADGRLFLGKHGKWGRLIETFHLKLRLLADCFSAVRALTAQTQRPFLNLTAQSFQVNVDATGGAGIAHSLPFLWTARASLIDPGDAVTLKMEGSEAQYFVRGLSAPANVYQPESVSKPASGRGTLRIRKVLSEAAGMILEGTLITQERLGEGGGPTRNDLIWLRVPVGSGRIDLYGHVEKEPALAAGEWRFRTERQKLPEPVLAQLKAGEGVPIPETLFDMIPLLSGPVDLYSLAVLGARALLVNHDTTLAIVADELLSLARQVALEHNANAPLGDRIRSIFQADARWLNSLGPHRLTRELIGGDGGTPAALTPQEAFDLIPADLWFSTLAMLIRMLPAIGPDSVCRDFGDAPRGGMHKIYDPIMNDLETLLIRTRSLIVIDWRFNREIHGVLRKISVQGRK